MEESNEDHNVVPELYFLIAKFLSGGPLKDTAKTLLKELESVEVLPRRLDWEGEEHAQSYDELASQYTEVSWNRLASVCERALRLARSPAAAQGQQLGARLSLLSESLVRASPMYASFKRDHSLVRRLSYRELGVDRSAIAGGRGGQATFAPRMLSGLQLQRRTLGHLSAVYCLVFDCTGRIVVTGADDLLVKVWSAYDGRLLTTLRGASAEITDACVSADGALLACGSVERLVRVWCLATAAPLAVLHAHQGTITSVHWAPPSRPEIRWLASTSTDGSVAFWTCSPDGQFLSQPVQYVERMRPGVCHMICAAWSPGGAFLAAGSADHHVRVYALEQGPGGPTRVLETAVHGDAVDSIAWAHRGLRFVSGSKDGSAALWTLHATQWRHSLLMPDTQAEGKRLKVTMVCWDCSDAYVITAVSDYSIRVWCSRTCTQVRSLFAHRDEAYVLEAHPFLSGVLLSAGHDGQLLVWDAERGEILARFHNNIEGQGDGAIFDAKWGGGAHVAASDSHGHLLLLGLGAGNKLLKQLPTELFFHTDYRPLVRDALGGALDEQTETPPHLMPPPFLVDVEGAPHQPEYQRLVPGRENLALNQLIPAADVTRNRIDLMIEALAAERTPPVNGGGGEGRGVWRGEGVRHTAGSWQSGDPLLVPTNTRPVVCPIVQAARERIEQASAELNALEQAWYRREMRRRPVMISTATGGEGGPPRRRGARRPPPAHRGPRLHARVTRVVEEPPELESSGSDTSDSSVRLSGSQKSSRASSLELTDASSSTSSQYSDWEAGAALAPPARARRRPLPATRYTPPATPAKKPPRACNTPDRAAVSSSASAPTPAPSAPTPVELPEAFRPGEWLTAVAPRKAPYHPQMGDHCLYFRLGHQRYFEAVAEKDLYKINPRDKPWERTHVYECELVKVVGIKYAIKPPRVVCLRLACSLEAPRTRSFTVRYHDMPDVIDFLVLRQQYEAATARHWGQGDRFRCMIDDSWWTGIVLERMGPSPGAAAAVPATSGCSEAQRWASAAAAHFLSLRVRWDNGEVERLSPWDLEPLDPERLPAEPGGCVPVLPHELEAVLYRAEPDEWPPRGDRQQACPSIAQHISQVMSLSVAEPFVAPVDLQLYPSYAKIVPYPIDLATIKARFENFFYRRTASAQFDVRYLASNAEQFNEPHSPIVRQARLVTDLLLYIISHWRDVDVLAKYHELAASYHSSDDEPLAPSSGTKSRHRRNSKESSEWREACQAILREVMASADAEPFRRPVSMDMAPDYHTIIHNPMDLGTVSARLASGEYSRADQLYADMRLVFANSRLYNTNKRSRIYSMTVRLSALFEALWSRMPPTRARRAKRHPRGTRRAKINGTHSYLPQPAQESSDSECETLAATSRRVHGRERRDDSWDSDVPLHTHRKGKGVGKKSKSSSASAEPMASTSRVPDQHEDPYQPEHNGVPSASEHSRNSDSESSLYTNIEVLEEELAEDEVELTYDDGRDQDHTPSGSLRARKRIRGLSSGSSEYGRVRRKHKRGRRNKPAKQIRERFNEGTPSSSSSSPSGSGSEGDSARRYESDRSYRPRYSTDDDAPLHLYRQRAEGNEEAGPSNARRKQNGHRSGGVSLRARSPRRYNEDSEEDSIAAISKRMQHHQHLARRRHHHLAQSVRAEPSAAHTNDHNYFNGHAPRTPLNGNAARSAGSASSGAAPVSISSRGRVRKLTAKARGLLRD